MDIPEVIRAKKRKKTGDVRKEAKRNKNSGRPYQTLENRRPIPGKAFCEEVSCRCQYACKVITVAARKKMFQEFWNLSNYNEQQNFLRSLIRPNLINRRRHGNYDDPNQSRRQHSFKYFLPLPGKSEAQVCKKTLCSTFGITQRRLEILSQRILSAGISVQDKRGGKRPARNQVWKQKIIEFIATIPNRESHYGREQIQNRRYLSEDLNVRKLYTAFLEKHQLDITKPPVSRQWFNEIFNKEFNLAFGVPRVDTCPTCDQYKISIAAAKTPVEKTEFQLKQNVHHRKAEAAQKMMSQNILDSKSTQSDVCVLSYDLQKQMYIPALTHTQMYYSRQFTCINLGIHFEDEGKGFMYMWDETAGKRGCNEIGSCLYNFVTTQLNTNKRKLVLWSDNCGGQNKNQGILAVYITLIAKGYFDEIVHKFPQSGHTFLSCDRDFGCIEKAKKGLKPEVPMDLVRIMASARLRNPFVIICTNKFCKWMEIARNTLVTSSLGISQAVMLKISKESLGYIEVKTSYSDLAAWRKVSIFKPTVTPQYFENLNIEMVEQKPRQWSKDKIKEIKSMIPFVSPANQTFYEKLVEEQESLQNA